jgi:hypothetical protein
VSANIAITDVDSVLMLHVFAKCATGVVTLHLQIIRCVTLVAMAVDIAADQILGSVQLARMVS